MKRVALRPPKAKRPARDGVRQLIVVLVIGAPLVLGLFAADEYLTVRQRAAAAAATAQSDEETYTGSILYMPDEGSLCRQILFDNQTGRFTDNGSVDCERAAYQGASGPPKRWSAARVRVISTGFRQH